LPGDIVDTAGRVIGRHNGLPFYTIGQRRGLNVKAGYPVYVTDIDTERNIMVVGRRDDLLKKIFIVEKPVWTSGTPPGKKFTAKVKIRYKHAEEKASINFLNDGRIKVVFATSQPAITPGQAAVFYKRDTVLGGGLISKVFK
jgi:tRNA-specific 2-thiouridylase